MAIAWLCASVGAPVTIAQHGAHLHASGYCILPQPVISAESVGTARRLCHTTLQRLLHEAEAAGCDPIEQMYIFDKVCHRQRNRWDLLIDADSEPAWQGLITAAIEAATPIIREAQGDAFSGLVPLMSGAVVSRPGARVQRFHCDATHSHFEAARLDPSHRIYNIFVPLVDIEEDGDGTMFWPVPCLEESTRALAKHILDSPDSCLDPNAIDAPSTAAGGLIIFDYRTIHRGLANPDETGRERPVAYVAVASGGAFDGYNFPKASMRDVSREQLQRLPFWNQGKAACDSLDYYTEIEGADEFAVLREDGDA